jgi:hypothetical protein
MSVEGQRTSKKALEGVGHILWWLRQSILYSESCIFGSLLGLIRQC